MNSLATATNQTNMACPFEIPAMLRIPVNGGGGADAVNAAANGPAKMSELGPSAKASSSHYMRVQRAGDASGAIRYVPTANDACPIEKPIIGDWNCV